MGFLYTLFSFVTGLLGSLLLLRAYLWSLAISPRDPLAAFVWKLTDWLVNPVGYLVRPRGSWDWTSLAAALLVALVQVLVGREITGYPVTPAGFGVAIAAMLIRWSVDLLLWAVILYCIMSFVSTRYSGYTALLCTLVDPFLRPFRQFIPRIGRFDLSPIVLFLLLNLILRWVVPASMGFLLI